MSETIKQAVDRCRGNIYALLHPNYTGGVPTLRIKISKPEAKKLIIDKAPDHAKPVADWEGDDLVLFPAFATPEPSP